MRGPKNSLLLYWLRVTAMPPSFKSSSNCPTATRVIRTRLKFSFREAIPGTSFKYSAYFTEANSIFRQSLEFHRRESQRDGQRQPNATR
ncbi:hypothetical protein BJ322DRAFT_1077592 [Thelephora terrestris]|uniref:Uncharacterized protein n=1 Tax=Thelephora terrestris TaxID=56493 RepID=A0A9P6H8M4_9AGAM|nr:hypothetical protein BJ322DRAFT_1077592 [Thelephora terrestris]